MARPGLTIRTDLASPAELRRLARREPRRRTMQRLLAVANALEGMSRADELCGRLGDALGVKAAYRGGVSKPARTSQRERYAYDHS
ncbi:hypothetical protein, partial [Methylobacterium sp. WSM2598]|uniref:hypothetical protein n=1 Tax=Methylobacterium sp. WSM2598 TaxID=398261 RepID=UPI001AEBBC95